MPHIISNLAGDRNDRISNCARPGGPRHHRCVGGVPVSAEVDRFMTRPRSKRAPADVPGPGFHSTPRHGDLVVDRGDMSACEYVGASHEGIRIDDGQSSY
jgi:hypothetical protein